MRNQNSRDKKQVHLAVGWHALGQCPRRSLPGPFANVPHLAICVCREFYLGKLWPAPFLAFALLGCAAPRQAYSAKPFNDERVVAIVRHAAPNKFWQGVGHRHSFECHRMQLLPHDVRDMTAVFMDFAGPKIRDPSPRLPFLMGKHALEEEGTIWPKRRASRRIHGGAMPPWSAQIGSYL